MPDFIYLSFLIIRGHSKFHHYFCAIIIYSFGELNMLEVPGRLAFFVDFGSTGIPEGTEGWNCFGLCIWREGLPSRDCLSTFEESC